MHNRGSWTYPVVCLAGKLLTQLSLVSKLFFPANKSNLPELNRPRTEQGEKAPASGLLLLEKEKHRQDMGFVAAMPFKQTIWCLASQAGTNFTPLVEQ